MQVLMIVAFVLCLIAESVTSWLFIRGSKKKHPALWEHAGSPTLMGNGDLLSAFPLIQYARRRDYAAVSDSEAVSFADRLRLPLIVTYWAAVASAMALIVTLLVGL